MSSLAARQRLIQRPTGIARLNERSDFARDLIFWMPYYGEGTSSPRDVSLSRNTVTLNGSLSDDVFREGPAIFHPDIGANYLSCSCPQIPTGSASPFTLAARTIPSKTQSGSAGGIIAIGTDTNDRAIFLAVSSVRFEIGFWGGTEIFGPSTVTIGNYYDVVGTFDGTNARLYVDGVLVAGPTLATNGGITTQTVWSGTYPEDAFSLRHGGYLWDSLVAARAWSAREVYDWSQSLRHDLYWRPKPIVPGFVGEAAAQNIQGSLFQDDDTLYHGKISIDVAGSFLQDADELYHGEIATGVVNVQGSILQDADVLYHGLISPQNLFGSSHQNVDVLYHGEIAAAAVDLEGSLFEDTDILYHGEIAAGTVDVAGSILEDTDTLHHGAISLNLSGSLFEDADTINQGDVSPINMFGSLLEDADNLFDGLLLNVAADIEGTLFADEDIFYHSFLLYDILGSIFDEEDGLFHGKIAGGVQVKIPRIVQTGLRGKLVRDYQSVYDDYPDPGV